MEDMFQQQNEKSSRLVRVLYELLQGKRELVRVYSRTLQQELCFVNTERVNPDLVPGDCPVYSTRELAHILSLSDEEFQRFHYLKTRLVG
ncbi:MAG: hypothetical protein EH225_05025 [Calditrichaeota bacterium]|nr:MAG: hypothetical protein EH225_05025 [Calditrichota bacterium]